MQTYRSFGPLGLIVLLFGLVAGLVTGDWTSMYVLAHLILGGMMVALYLFTHLDALKESVGGRQAKYGTNALVYTLITLAVIVIVNYLAVQHPVRWDLTEEGVFSLAPQTAQLLDGIDSDIVARAFFREGEEGAVRDLLESFAAASDRFGFEFIDPDKRPEMAEQYEIAEYSTVHVTVGTETSRIAEAAEQELTNTLIRLTQARRRIAYFLTGHGEPDPEDSTSDTGYGQAKSALDNEGYDVVPLVLGTVPDVPGDADLLILTGPQRPLLEREIVALDRYLHRGGAAMIMIDPQQGDQIVELLASRGIELGDDVIIEQFVQLFAGATLGLEPIVGDYGFHPITSGFSERTIFRMARSVSAAEELPDGVTVSELARTSDSSWAEIDLERLFDNGEVTLDDDDTAGPIALAVAATLEDSALEWTAPLIDSAPDGSDTPDSDAVDDTETSDTDDTEAPAADGTDATSDTVASDGADSAPADLEGRLVVFGDSVWASNRYLSNYFNQDLFLNAVGWLAGKEELISIRPRRTRASRVMLTQNESQAVFYVTVLLLPELILLCGMLLWLGRRNR